MAVPLNEQIKTLFTLVKEPKTLIRLLSQRHSGYLREVGWFQSFANGKPLNSAGEPIPWLTYPAIDFLTARMQPSFNIFEFGAGNSTLWFAKRVRSVTSVEHDAQWLQSLTSVAPKNVTLIHKKADDILAYVNAAAEKPVLYDIILVDAIYRNECIFNSVTSLDAGGVLILDNSEREEYKPGREFLTEKGFRFIDFWGMVPGQLTRNCTSIYYRDNNVLLL